MSNSSPLLHLSSFPLKGSLLTVKKSLTVLLIVHVHAQTSACSGNGLLSPFTSTCNCFQCYYPATTCSKLNSSCTIQATVADAFMFEQWFDEQSAAEAARLSVTISSTFSPSYRDPFVFPAFNNSINQKTHEVLAKLHKAEGNFNTSGRTLLLGDGSTQVISALIHAIARIRGDEIMYVYARPPYYPTFESWISLLEGVEWTNRTDLKANVIELVTWPNNPNGYEYEPVYSKDIAVHIYDLVYYWPHTSPKPLKQLDVDYGVFSSSKLTGHASSRFGWAWVRDEAVAFATIGYSFTTTYGISMDSLYRQVNILDALPTTSFFNDMKDEFHVRWKRVEEAVAASDGRVDNRGAVGTWFLWLRCSDSIIDPPTMTCEDYVLRKANVKGVYGEDETGIGGDEAGRFVRLNLNLRRHTFDLFIQRLKLL